MNIGINARLLISNKLEGIGRFAFESLKELVKLRKQDTFFFFFDRNYDTKFIFADNIVPVILNPQARHPILWDIWFGYSLPKAIKKHKIDLLFSPEGYIAKNVIIPQISTHHDVNFLLFPDLVKGWNGYYLRKKFPQFAKKSDKVLTVSKFSKTEIIKHYPLNEDKIDVCYNGVSNDFRVLEEENSDLEKKYALKDPFFIFIGALSDRKNIAGMLKAFSLFKEKNTKYKFLIVGDTLFKSALLEDTLKKISFKEDVRFLGRLADKEIVFLLNKAKALLYISKYEGFGLPIIEAQKCGCPVLTSTTSCMPEIGGENSALYADPDKVNEMALKMEEIIQDKTQLFLKQEGLINAKKYTWHKVANSINKAIEDVKK